MDGFGLAPVKKEGHCASSSEPWILPWKPLTKEFQLYSAKYSAWYLAPVRKLFIAIARDSWDKALYEKAKIDSLWW